MRVFIGIETGVAQENLWGAADLIANASGGRATKKNNIHLTVKFLGEVRDIRPIAAAMDTVCMETGVFDLVPDEIVYKPRQKMAWCTLKGDTEALLRLQNRLEEALEPLGFARENRLFLPHITLVRDAYKNWDMQDVTLNKKSFSVSRLVLFESLQSGGLKYIPRHIAAFGVNNGR